MDFNNIRPSNSNIEENINKISDEIKYPDDNLKHFLDQQINKIINDLKLRSNYESRNQEIKEEIDVMIMQTIWHIVLSSEPNWGTIVYLYLKFLQGLIPASPMHLGKLTLDINDTAIQDLMKINKFGFLTIDSQPGVCENFTNPINQKTGKEEQRQYISGYLLKKIYPKFIEYLTRYGNDEIAYEILDSNNRVIKRHYPNWVHERRHDNINYHHFKNHNIIPFTYSKLDDDNEWLLETRKDISPFFRQFNKSTEYGPYYPGQKGFQSKPILDFHEWIKQNTVYVVIISKYFCKPNILNDLILRVLVESEYI